jgi:hypothetical protein
MVIPDEEPPGERRFGEGADGELPVTRNRHAFRVAVRNVLFRRVNLLAREAYDALGQMDGDAAWDAARWEAAMAPYWAEYDWLGTGPEARAAGLVTVVENPTEADLPDLAGLADGTEVVLPARAWLVRQTFDDPAGDHDWGLTAVVDLDASDAADGAVVRVLTVGPR